MSKDKSDTYLDQIEGRNPVSEAIQAGRSINKVWISDSSSIDNRLQNLLEKCKESGAVVMRVDKMVLDSMSESSNHQGIIAQVSPIEYVEPFAHLDNLRKEGRDPFILILDNLQDGFNFGSIIRISEAAGIDLIVIPERRSVSVDAHVAKASAGAVEYVPIARVTNLATFIDRIKEDGFWIFGTDVDAAENYQKANYQGSIALIIGNEAKGMSKNIKKRCDFLVTIPMQGKINSLNAAVATGIVVFQAVEQRKNK